MAKAQGAIFYIDVDSDSQYRDVGCIYDLVPVGMERAVITGEACLADAASTDITGDLKYTVFTGTLQMAPTGTIQAEIEAAILADTSILFCVKHPLAVPIYQFGTGKFASYQPEAFDREAEMKYTISILPSAAYTYSTTAPTPEA